VACGLARSEGLEPPAFRSVDARTGVRDCSDQSVAWGSPPPVVQVSSEHPKGVHPRGSQIPLPELAPPLVGGLPGDAEPGTDLGPGVPAAAQALDCLGDGGVQHLVGATRGRRESTKVSYRDALRPVRERLGARTLQSVSKADVENLVDWMLTSGRRRGGRAGTGLGPRSVRLTLGRLKAAFEMAVDEGRLVRNVVKLVTPPEYTPGERATWSRTEVRRFLRWPPRTGSTRRGV
jgi:hypothetical protein